jgi:hypothetical protein
LELLDKNDQVIRVLKARPSENTFEYLLPGEYYLRMYVDTNENGRWDTGNFRKNRVPEQVYYCPMKITLRANFDQSYDWDPTSIPWAKQKPKALIKKQDKTAGASGSASR